MLVHISINTDGCTKFQYFGFAAVHAVTTKSLESLCLAFNVTFALLQYTACK